MAEGGTVATEGTVATGPVAPPNLIDLQREAMHRIRRKIVDYLDVAHLIHMSCVTQRDRQRIRAVLEGKGQSEASGIFVELFFHREGWWEEFLETLREDCDQEEIADSIETVNHPTTGDKNQPTVVNVYHHHNHYYYNAASPAPVPPVPGCFVNGYQIQGMVAAAGTDNGLQLRIKFVREAETSELRVDVPAQLCPEVLHNAQQDVRAEEDMEVEEMDMEQEFGLDLYDAAMGSIELLFHVATTDPIKLQRLHEAMVDTSLPLRFERALNKTLEDTGYTGDYSYKDARLLLLQTSVSSGSNSGGSGEEAGGGEPKRHDEGNEGDPQSSSSQFHERARPLEKSQEASMTTEMTPEDEKPDTREAVISTLGSLSRRGRPVEELDSHDDSSYVESSPSSTWSWASEFSRYSAILNTMDAIVSSFDTIDFAEGKSSLPCSSKEADAHNFRNLVRVEGGNRVGIFVGQHLRPGLEDVFKVGEKLLSATCKFSGAFEAPTTFNLTTVTLQAALEIINNRLRGNVVFKTVYAPEEHKRFLAEKTYNSSGDGFYVHCNFRKRCAGERHMSILKPGNVLYVTSTVWSQPKMWYASRIGPFLDTIESGAVPNLELARDHTNASDMMTKRCGRNRAGDRSWQLLLNGGYTLVQPLEAVMMRPVVLNAPLPVIEAIHELLLNKYSIEFEFASLDPRSAMGYRIIAEGPDYQVTVDHVVNDMNPQKHILLPQMTAEGVQALLEARVAPIVLQLDGLKGLKGEFLTELLGPTAGSCEWPYTSLDDKFNAERVAFEDLMHPNDIAFDVYQKVKEVQKHVLWFDEAVIVDIVLPRASR